MTRAVKFSLGMLGDGHKVLERKLARMAAGTAKKHVRRALRAGAKVVLPVAKQKAAAISNSSNNTELMLAVASGLKLETTKRKRGRLEIRIVTPPRDKLGLPPWSKKGKGRFYAPAHVEFGHDNVPAMSYLRSALHENEERVIRVIWVTLWRGIRSEAGRA